MFIADPSKNPGNVFMYILRPARPAMLSEGPTENEKRLAAEHWEYSQNLLEQGVIMFAGRTLVHTDDCMANIVIRATSTAEAEQLMNDDPAVKGGLFSAKLFPYQPMLMGD